MRALRQLVASAQDPFGFTDAFRDLQLSADDLPSLTRECRLAGEGR